MVLVVVVVVGSQGEGRQSGDGKGQQFGGVCGTGDGASHPVTSTSAVARSGGQGRRVQGGIGS